jgi:Ran GTPase-activating protein (RanGAP) involved in mRNA processing and transport
MGDKLDDLASHLDDALVSADELQDTPEGASKQEIQHAKSALAEAKDAVDEMEDEEMEDQKMDHQ